MEHTTVPLPGRRLTFGRERSSNRVREGDGSRGQGGWDEASVDFRCHDCCPEFLGLSLSKGWLHVEIKKGMKEDESEKGHEEEAFDGRGIILQNMIGVPTLD
jgi:hypothetical protein